MAAKGSRVLSGQKTVKSLKLPPFLMKNFLAAITCKGPENLFGDIPLTDICQVSSNFDLVTPFLSQYTTQLPGWNRVGN